MRAHKVQNEKELRNGTQYLLREGRKRVSKKQRKEEEVWWGA